MHGCVLPHLCLYTYYLTINHGHFVDPELPQFPVEMGLPALDLNQTEAGDLNMTLSNEPGQLSCNSTHCHGQLVIVQ